MLTTYILATGLILAVLLGWVTVQHLARRFAARHPEFGPARERMTCGMSCSCEENCAKKDDGKSGETTKEKP